MPSGDKDRVSRVTGGSSRANGDVTESGGGGPRGDWSASLPPSPLAACTGRRGGVRE